MRERGARATCARCAREVREVRARGARGARARCARCAGGVRKCTRERHRVRTGMGKPTHERKQERTSKQKSVCARVFAAVSVNTGSEGQRGRGQVRPTNGASCFYSFLRYFQISIPVFRQSLIAVRKVCLHLQQQRCLAWVESQHATTIFPSHFISFPEGQRVSWRAANLRQWRHSCRQSLILDLTTWLLVSWLRQKQARRHVNPIQQACGEASVKFGRLR